MIVNFSNLLSTKNGKKFKNNWKEPSDKKASGIHTSIKFCNEKRGGLT